MLECLSCLPLFRIREFGALGGDQSGHFTGHLCGDITEKALDHLWHGVPVHTIPNQTIEAVLEDKHCLGRSVLGNSGKYKHS